MLALYHRESVDLVLHLDLLDELLVVQVWVAMLRIQQRRQWLLARLSPLIVDASDVG